MCMFFEYIAVPLRFSCVSWHCVSCVSVYGSLISLDSIYFCCCRSCCLLFVVVRFFSFFFIYRVRRFQFRFFALLLVAFSSQCESTTIAIYSSLFLYIFYSRICLILPFLRWHTVLLVQWFSIRFFSFFWSTTHCVCIGLRSLHLYALSSGFNVFFPPFSLLFIFFIEFFFYPVIRCFIRSHLLTQFAAFLLFYLLSVLPILP